MALVVTAILHGDGTGVAQFHHMASQACLRQPMVGADRVVRREDDRAAASQPVLRLRPVEQVAEQGERRLAHALQPQGLGGDVVHAAIVGDILGQARKPLRFALHRECLKRLPPQAPRVRRHGKARCNGRWRTGKA